MNNSNLPINPSARVILSLLQHQPKLTIYAKHMPYDLPADVVELDSYAGRLVLEAEYNGKNIEHYIKNDHISLDIEALSLPEHKEREVYSLSNVPVRLTKIDSHLYQLECSLPDSVFVSENRGAVRIPFILGMQVRVNVEVFLHELSLSGRLRNLSIGGCLIDIDIAESIAFNIGQVIPGITLEFPNGESFYAEGRVRHMRPFGNQGYAALGIEFINLTSTQSEALFQYVSESEREAAYRSGTNEKITNHSPLFIPGAKEKKLLHREEQERKKRARQAPMQRGVLEIAHRLQVGLMYLNTQGFFPEDIFYDCADTLIYLAQQERKSLLYALAFLQGEPDWVRHAVQVAGQLADILQVRDPHSPYVREAILGTLLHTMGKPLLVSEALPSLKAHMTPHQREILTGHVACLRSKLEACGWEASPTCCDILENANERLDGSGYPNGKRGSQLTELVKLVSVLKIINKLTHQRNGTPPRCPLDAYRWVNDVPGAYEKCLLVEYIQLYGLYPIGSLAKFSKGFLAWIMDIDGKGLPCKVNVVKNLAFLDSNIDIAISTSDFSMIGKLEDIVNPADYGIKFSKT